MTNYKQPPEMITLHQAADRLKAASIPIGYQLLRRLCSQGKLNCCRIGRFYLLNWEYLLDYFQNGGEAIK